MGIANGVFQQILGIDCDGYMGLNFFVKTFSTCESSGDEESIDILLYLVYYRFLPDLQRYQWLEWIEWSMYLGLIHYQS
jgi:hypothetical protein